MSIRKDWQQPRLPPIWVEVIITILGFASIVFALSYYQEAFTIATIDLSVSRAEIMERAQAYMSAQGYALDGYESVLTFGEDSYASYFLQRTLGAAEANRRIRAEKLPIWGWHVRWFKPSQKEEFGISLATDGVVTSFSHDILENTPGAKLASEQARQLAEKFLTENRGWVLSEWESVAASSEDRPGGRTDHYLAWKRRDFGVGEAELRLTVDVQGDRIGAYNYWIKTPESFNRQFEEQRNRAGFWGSLSYLIGFMGIGGITIGVFLIGNQRGIRFDPLGKGVVIAVALITLLTSLNMLPLAKAGYSTTQDYSIFWTNRLMGAFFNMAFVAFGVAVLWMGARIISHQVWRYQDKILPRGDDRWIILARSGWRGLMLGCMMGGYVVLFYVVATQVFGSWTPIEADYSDAYATFAPFLAPLSVGLIPATTEELLFRVAGIPLFLLLTRRRILALLIPGAIWAFAHLGYVTDPFYLRGIELTIAAFFLEGLFFYHFDAATTIIAHFVYNAGLTALPLLNSNDPYFVASGLIVVAFMFVPIVPGAIRALRNRVRGKNQPAPQMNLRAASLDDLTALQQLTGAEIDWGKVFAQANPIIVCLYADHQLVGAASALVDDQQLAHLDAVFIAPAWRRRYWATVLVDELATIVKERGATHLQAMAYVADKPTTAFWASQNWYISAHLFVAELVAPASTNWRERIWNHFNSVRGMLGM